MGGPGIPRVKMKIGTDRGASWQQDIERIGARSRCDRLPMRNSTWTPTAPTTAPRGGASGCASRKSSGQLVRRTGLLRRPDGACTATRGAAARCHRRRVRLRPRVLRAHARSRAVDVLQADVGRCAGITEWLRVASTCAAHQTPLSAHCGQSLHAHVACVPPNLRHIEYFHDHPVSTRSCSTGH